MTASLQQINLEVLQELIAKSQVKGANARDLEILNREADALSAEAEDTLLYQADPFRPEFE